MESDTTVAVNDAGSTPGLAASAGQAAADTPRTPTPDANSQTAQATPSGQAAGQGDTPKALWNDLSSAERDYKALQAEFTRTKQQMAKLGDLTAAEQRLALLGQLQQDPKFREWAQSRLAEAETGSGDPETVQALNLVDQVASRRVQEALAPIVAQLQGARLAAVTQAMDQKHPEWKDHKERVRDNLMAGIQAGIFPQSVVHNMSLEFLEKLYAMTVGLDEDHQAKVYAKRLAQKQSATSQSTPGVAPAATAHAPAKSMHEALALARKQLG